MIMNKVLSFLIFLVLMRSGFMININEPIKGSFELVTRREIEQS